MMNKNIIIVIAIALLINGCCSNPLDSKGKYVLNADKMVSENQTLVLKGHAIFQFKNFTVTADKVILDMKNPKYIEMKAIGNAKIIGPDGNVLEGEIINLPISNSDSKILENWEEQLIANE
jgi:lipopolysaccharide assembly outer membrane protein LptD (OstA)